MTAFVETPDSDQNLGVYGSAKLVAIRVCRLNLDCSPMLGSKTAVATAAIVKADVQPQYYEGKEYLLVQGNGSIGLYAKDADRLKRSNISVELATRDFELIEILTGATLIPATPEHTTVAAGSNGVDPTTFTNAGGTLNVASTTGFPSTGTLLVDTSMTDVILTYTGLGGGGTTFTGVTYVSGGGGGTLATGGDVDFSATLGYGIRTVGANAPGYVSVEIWSNTISAFGVCNTQNYFKTIWPHATFTLGNSTFQNDIATVMLNGFTTNNPNWGTGIDDLFPAPGQWPTGSPEVEYLDVIGPPTLQPGYLDTVAPSSPTAYYTAH